MLKIGDYVANIGIAISAISLIVAMLLYCVSISLNDRIANKVVTGIAISSSVLIITILAYYIM